jgi:hypothetical protein
LLSKSFKPFSSGAPDAPDSVIKLSTQAMFENFKRRQYARRAQVLLRLFHRPRRVFLLVLPPRHLAGKWTSHASRTVVASFKRMQECSGVKKLLAYEKEVNEGFAKTTDATIEVRRRTELPRSRTIPLRVTARSN